MQKQVILLMESGQYPFGQFQHSAMNTPQYPKNTQPLTISQRTMRAQTKIRVLVRKIFSTKSLQQRNQLLQKIGIIRNLDHPNIIKIQSVLEQQNGIHILMQYVPIRLNDFINKNKKDGYDIVSRSVYDLERNLRQQGIGIQWNFQFIGFNSNSQCKYYINVDKMFIQPDLNRLRKNNQKDLGIILQQLHGNIYPMDNVKRGGQNKNKHRKGSSFDLQTQAQNIQLFDPQSSYNSNNNKSRQSIQAKTPSQRMKVNWRQIQQNSEILNDFINVLEDRQDNFSSHQDTAHIQKSISQEQQIQIQKKQKVLPQVLSHPILDQVQQIQQVVWQNSNQLQQKVAAAIERSRKVMEVFKNVTALYK